MSQELKPLSYTIHEGGNWMDWPEDTLLNIDDLVKRGYPTIVISGLSIHSIAFGNVLTGWGSFIRWDCVNGFTDEPEEIIY